MYPDVYLDKDLIFSFVPGGRKRYLFLKKGLVFISAVVYKGV